MEPTNSKPTKETDGGCRGRVIPGSGDYEGKEKIEINYVGGNLYVNFWDWAHGNDVIAKVVNGKLIHLPPEEIDTKEITFNDFLVMMAESIDKRTV